MSGDVIAIDKLTLGFVLDKLHSCRAALDGAGNEIENVFDRFKSLGFTTAHLEAVEVVRTKLADLGELLPDLHEPKDVAYFFRDCEVYRTDCLLLFGDGTYVEVYVDTCSARGYFVDIFPTVEQVARAYAVTALNKDVHRMVRGFHSQYVGTFMEACVKSGLVVLE